MTTQMNSKTNTSNSSNFEKAEKYDVNWARMYLAQFADVAAIESNIQAGLESGLSMQEIDAQTMEMIN